MSYWSAAKSRIPGAPSAGTPGLYLPDMQFLRRRKSALIDGAGDDARELSAHLTAYLESGRKAWITLTGAAGGAFDELGRVE